MSRSALALSVVGPWAALVGLVFGYAVWRPAFLLGALVLVGAESTAQRVVRRDVARERPARATPGPLVVSAGYIDHFAGRAGVDPRVVKWLSWVPLALLGAACLALFGHAVLVVVRTAMGDGPIW